MTSRICALVLAALLMCLSFAQGKPPVTANGGGLKQVLLLQKSQGLAKAAYNKQKSAKNKAAYVEATNALAYATMTADGLSPKVKYPKALQLYREALKVDPTNKVAKSNADMIVSIYKSMHRPVPGGG